MSRPLCRMRSGDEVIVIAGKDRGRRGTIQQVLPDGRLIVSGVQRVKKHQKPDPQNNRPGGIVEREAPIQASNVAIWNSATGAADRIGWLVQGGRKIRVYKSTGKPI